MRNNLTYKNPAFNPEMLDGMTAVAGEVMTVGGTLRKLAISLVLMFLGAMEVWTKQTAGFTDFVTMVTGISLVAVLVIGFIIIFKRNSEIIKYLVPAYALGEGFLLGSISCTFEKMFPGIVSQAIAGTILAVGVMLFLYYNGIIKVTDKFRSVMLGAITTIFGVYMIDFIMSLFHHPVPFIHSASPVGIIISMIVVGILCFNLMIDFDFIEYMSHRLAPKHLEWYGAFGVLVSVVWLYMEILELLAKVNSRR